MLGYVRGFFDSRGGTPHKGTPLVRESLPSMARPAANRPDRGQFYSKVFRYRLPDGCVTEPATVEVVGSFTHWQKVPLVRDGKLDAWHTTIHHIPGNRTHHYMYLVDGRPTFDKTCDGFAVPHGSLEEQYQLATDKGPRVLILFAQTR
jgi:hypothetical protein